MISVTHFCWNSILILTSGHQLTCRCAITSFLQKNSEIFVYQSFWNSMLQHWNNVLLWFAIREMIIGADTLCWNSYFITNFHLAKRYLASLIWVSICLLQKHFQHKAGKGAFSFLSLSSVKERHGLKTSLG